MLETARLYPGGDCFELDLPGRGDIGAHNEARYPPYLVEL